MYPLYRNMDSYPHQRNQMPPAYPYFPSFDPARSYVPHKPSPYGCNYGYPMPVGFHGCCNHNYLPGCYNYRPPYSHFQPPSLYPVCLQTYPFHYTSSPHCPMEQPRYEYNKNGPRDHCCECHHLCKSKEDSNVKNQEHEPDVDGGDGKRIENQGNEESNQFPFPIFWMPYKANEIGSKDHEETNTGQKSIEELPSNNDRMIQPWETKEKSGSEVGSKKMEKNANQKTIPVKQLEQHEEKRTSESVDEKAGGITVNHIEGNGEKRLPENGVKSQPSSLKNASKLPPVCLRVDPLPKRKKGSGSSRSPSPPGLKRSSELHSETSKNTQQEIQCMNPPLHETKQAEPSEKDKKVAESAEGIILHDKGENCSISTHEKGSENQITCEAEKHMEERKPGEEIKSGDGESEIKEEEGTRKAEEEKSDESVKEESKKLSEAEAAVIIQSAYRGFEVRRWESLKKLKQIAQVREDMVWIRTRIQALQSSGISSVERERVVIGENIMNLLLKLDAIQGMHPSIRDVRKSVAKELVTLQETLDSLTITKSDVSTAEAVEDLSKITGDDHDIKEEQKEAKEVGLEDNFSHSGHDYKSDHEERCEGQPLRLTQEETSQLMVFEKEESDGLKEENLEMNQSMESQNGVLEEEFAGDESRKKDQIEQGIDVVSQVESIASIEKSLEMENNVGSSKKDENLLEDGKLEIEAVGKELCHIDELVKVSESKDEKVGPKEEIEKITAQQEMGDMGDIVEASKPEEILHRSKEDFDKIIVQQEINMGNMGNLVEAPKPEEILDNGERYGNSSGSEDSELKKPLFEISAMGHEIHDMEVQEDDAIIDANDNSPAVNGTVVVSQEKEVPTEKEVIGEEHQGCGRGSELGSESDRKLIDENEKLRKMMEKLIETGQEQLTAIANLNGRVKDLEKKLAKKKTNTRRFRAARTGSSSVKNI